jgi:Ni/Co efflux regulator RcnB
MNTSVVPRAVALALCAFLFASPVLAEKPEWAGGKDKHEHKHKDKDKDKGEKHGHKAKSKHRDEIRVGGYFNDDHRHRARSYYTQQYNGHCPPGLAKKNNGCMPPGQAKKYAVGQPLPSGVVYYPVPQPVIVQLPPVPPGYRYVRVGNDILLLSPQSALVVDVIVNIFG